MSKNGTDVAIGGKGDLPFALLLSYGPDRVDIFRRSASYVDRILRGAKPAALPVQLSTKFEMTVNVKTAKSLGLDVLFFRERAEEVIE